MDARSVPTPECTPLTGVLVKRSAVHSADGRYRYVLRREWSSSRPLMCWVMLNPSVADSVVDDPTTRRCMHLARREGLGGIVVINLYALCCTHPTGLRLDGDPEGVDNPAAWDAALRDKQVSRIVCAWGSFSDRRIPPSRALTHRWQLLEHAEVLGWTRGGAPRHPLYVRASARFDALYAGPPRHVGVPC